MSVKEKGKRTVMNKMLPALSIFAQWLTANGGYMSCTVESASIDSQEHTPHSSSSASASLSASGVQVPSMFMSDGDSPALSMSSKEWGEKHYADKEFMRCEVRIRSAMRAALNSIKAIIAEDFSRNPHRQDMNETAKSGAGKGKQRGAASTAGDLHVREEQVELRGFLPLSDAIEVML